jgi:hypothetical protein
MDDDQDNFPSQGFAALCVVALMIAFTAALVWLWGAGV